MYLNNGHLPGPLTVSALNSVEAAKDGHTLSRMETMEPKVFLGGRNLEAILMYGLFPYYRLYFFSTMIQIMDQYHGQIFIISLSSF